MIRICETSYADLHFFSCACWERHHERRVLAFTSKHGYRSGVVECDFYATTPAVSQDPNPRRLSWTTQSCNRPREVRHKYLLPYGGMKCSAPSWAEVCFTDMTG